MLRDPIIDLTDDRIKKADESNKVKSKTREHSPLKCICSFFKFMGAAISFVRNVVANLVFLLFLAVLGMLWMLSDSAGDHLNALIEGNEVQKELTPAPVLWLSLNGELDEIPPGDDQISKMLSQFSSNLRPNEIRVDLHQLLRVLHKAASDDEIKTVVADVSNLTLPSSQSVLRLIDACDEFKEITHGKKPLIFFSDSFSQGTYIAASHAGEIILDPFGSVDIHGLSMSTLYYAPLLERFKLTPYVFRAGTHKSAVEPLLRDSMSPEVKEEYSHIANSLWAGFEEIVKKGRTSLKGELLPDADEYLKSMRDAQGDNARRALFAGLVDKLMTLDDLKKSLADLYPAKDDITQVDAISLDNYEALYAARAKKNKVNSQKQLAVIYGMGTISQSNDNPRAFSPDNMEYLLDTITKDPKNKGVLLYIDSGGGEVTASEQIRRMIVKLHEKGIKVAVYMADVTASGAYWIATAADKIYASEHTITGSIGVFATTIGADRLLNEYGVTQDGVSTSPLAETAIASPINRYQKELIELEIGNTYDKFLKLVCKARRLDIKNREQFAEGKVFTATDAKKLGLIDDITTLQGAIDALEAECGMQKDESVWRSYVVPMGSNLGMLPQLLVNKLGSLLPESALKLLLDLPVTGDKKQIKKTDLMAIDNIRARL